MRNLLIILILLFPLTGCLGTTTPLPAGLTASMSATGAQLDKTAATNLINQYRAANNLGQLSQNAELHIVASQAAARYAKDGTQKGANALVKESSTATAMFSAGYSNFAETFSGWRNSPRDAKILLSPSATKIGIGIAYNANSSFGTHWVLLVAE